MAFLILKNPVLILFKVISIRFETSGKSSRNSVTPVKTKNLSVFTDTLGLFTRNKFINEIIWKRQSSHNDAKQGSKHLGRVHDNLLLYAGGYPDWTAQARPVEKGGRP